MIPRAGSGQSLPHSRFRLRFFAAAALALALSVIAFDFLMAGEPGSVPSFSELPLLTALAPPLAVSGVGLQPPSRACHCEPLL